MVPQSSPYTSSQLTAYLTLIGLPKKYWPSSNPTRDITMLTALHIHAISTHPYDNLSLHYTPSVNVSLDPLAIYKKFMSNGRGGYCFEHGIFFNHILKAMGFTAVHMAGVRIRMRVDGVPVGDYSGWRHVVNIITLPTGQKYMSDIAFGGDGPTHPLPLHHNTPTKNLGTQQVRLTHSHIHPQSLHLLQDADADASKMWIYEYRNSPSAPWNAFYAFPAAVEFFAADFEILNYFISQSPDSFQTYRLLVVKFLRAAGGEVGKGEREGEVGKGEREGEVGKGEREGEVGDSERQDEVGKSEREGEVGEGEREGEEENREASIRGKIMLVGDLVKLNTGGRTRVIQTCRSEEERVEALKKHFGIELSDEERAGISGRASELGN